MARCGDTFSTTSSESMGKVHHSTTTLRIFGDDLQPDEITRLLKCQPSKAELKGQVIKYPSGRKRTVKHGNWRLVADDAEPGNIDAQIRWILSQTSNDLDIWKRLVQTYDIDMFCGVFMDSSNDGFSLSPETLLMLGERGIEIDFDIYDASDDEEMVSNMKFDTDAARRST
jgi:hypothetical protein